LGNARTNGVPEPDLLERIRKFERALLAELNYPHWTERQQEVTRFHLKWLRECVPELGEPLANPVRSLD